MVLYVCFQWPDERILAKIDSNHKSINPRTKKCFESQIQVMRRQMIQITNTDPLDRMQHMAHTVKKDL